MDKIESTPGQMVSALMLWREEQLAIANLMLSRDGELPECIGFNDFTDHYDERYSKWFDRFASELDLLFPRGRGESERLRLVHELLARLVLELDQERAVVQVSGGEVSEPKWAVPSRYAKKS